MPERNAPYWRMKADEARRRATGMHDESAKETMLDIANRYDAMAQQAEGREVRARTKTKKPNASN